MRAWVAHIETHLDHMSVFAQERHAIEREPEWEARAREPRRVRGDPRPPAAAIGITDRLQHFALLGMVNHTATWVQPGGRLSAEQIADGYCDMILR